MNKFIRGMVLIGFGLLLQNSSVFAAKCIDETVTDAKIKYADEVLQACDNNDLAKIKSKLVKSGNPTFDKNKLLDRLNPEENLYISPFSATNVFTGNLDIPMKSTTGMVMLMRATDDPNNLFKLVTASNKKPLMVTTTSKRLTWSDDLRSVGLFLRVLAPKSESLRNAWNQIMIADFTLLIYSRLANKEREKSLSFKKALFSKLIPRLTEVGEELAQEERAIKDVKIWVFKDTKAARDVVLATIPVIEKAIQRMIKDYGELESLELKEKSTALAAALKATEEQRIKLESEIALETLKALHDEPSDSVVTARKQQEYVLKEEMFDKLDKLLDKTASGTSTPAEEAEVVRLSKLLGVE